MTAEGANFNWGEAGQAQGLQAGKASVESPLLANPLQVDSQSGGLATEVQERDSGAQASLSSLLPLGSLRSVDQSQVSLGEEFVETETRAPGRFLLREEPDQEQWTKGFLPGVAKWCLAVALTYTLLFNFSVVRGRSMTPRIQDGDRVLIDHLSYMFSEVERGDVVVLKYPLDPSVDYIKRVIGLPGDEIVMQAGQVWVNGEELTEPYVEFADPSSYLRVEVKAAHFFVLGDNRVRSSDSRDFGLVPCDYVRGKVEMRVWPPKRFGVLDQPEEPSPLPPEA